MNQRLTRITGLAMLTLTLATLAAPTAQAAAATTLSPEETTQTATGAQSRFHPEIPGFDITLPEVHATPDSQLNHPGTMITLPEVSAITPPVIAGQPDFHPEVPGITITLPEVTAPEQSTDNESTNQSNPSDQTTHHTTQPNQPSTPSTGTHVTPEQPAVPAPTTPDKPVAGPLPLTPPVPSEKPGNITVPDVTDSVVTVSPQTKPVVPTPQPSPSHSYEKPMTGPLLLVPTMPSTHPGFITVPEVTDTTTPVSPQTRPVIQSPLVPVGTAIFPGSNSKVTMIISHKADNTKVTVKKGTTWFTDSTLREKDSVTNRDAKSIYSVTQQADLQIDDYIATYVEVTRVQTYHQGKHVTKRWLPIQCVTDVK